LGELLEHIEEREVAFHFGYFAMWRWLRRKRLLFILFAFGGRKGIIFSSLLVRVLVALEGGDVVEMVYYNFF
jgi:hypothetical protein